MTRGLNVLDDSLSQTEMRSIFFKQKTPPPQIETREYEFITYALDQAENLMSFPTLMVCVNGP